MPALSRSAHVRTCSHIIRLLYAFCFLCVLLMVPAGAEEEAGSVSLAIRTPFGASGAATFSAGDLLHVTLDIEGFNGREVDAYFVLVEPDGTTRSFGSSRNFGLPNVISPMVGSWEAVDVEEATILHHSLPAGLRTGPYLWYFVLTRPEGDINDKSTWMAWDRVRMYFMGANPDPLNGDA